MKSSINAVPFGAVPKSILSVLLIVLSLLFSNCARSSSSELETDVLVIGAGASGTMASIQAARLGALVVVVEETPWVGGMLTAAGVSAIDGNHMLAGGLWGEFRSRLYGYYGGPEAVETGWVSNTLFAPHVGQQILRAMIESEPNITLRHGYRVDSMLMEGNRVVGAEFVSGSGERIRVRAKVTIAADEYGDALALSGAGYRFGFESRASYGDVYAPEVGNDRIQDLTYVAILKDYGTDADKTIERPDGYDPSVFDGTCKQLSTDLNANVVDCGPESGKELYMLNYGALPGGYFMINWPIHGNDYYLNLLDWSPEKRAEELIKAKNFTLEWIYHVQTVGGYRNLGIADDVFPTEDNLPFIPYIRESRRVHGVTTLRTQDLLNPYAVESEQRYQFGIAVGDYPLDLHHERKSGEDVVHARTEDLPKIPSYSVPYGTLIPVDRDGLIVAEKSISTTHIVNGATRLQPVVMLLGQAAGAAAWLSVQRGVEPRAISVRELQHILLDANAWLIPFVDVRNDQVGFKEVQRMGLTGLMRGVGQPVAWANRTWFYPDSLVTAADLMLIHDRLRSLVEGVSIQTFDFESHAQGAVQTTESIGRFLMYWEHALSADPQDALPDYVQWRNRRMINYSAATEPMTRLELALFADSILKPFEKFPISLEQ
jgi:hypothetical protein